MPRLTVVSQLARLAAHGIERADTYIEGDGPESLDALIKALRQGEVVGVTRLHMLAPPKLRTSDRPRRALWAAIQAIEAKGASIFEVESGRSTSSKSERDGMIADAIEALTHAGRSPRRRDGAGRPKVEFAPDIVEQARVVWFDLRHKTNEAARAAGPKGWSMWRYYRTFGPSGRDN